MTAEIINLKRARKARERAGKDAQAAVNRAQFGRSRAERDRTEAEETLRKGTLDGAKREPDGEGASGGTDPEAQS